MCMAELLYLINYWSKHLMLRLNIQEFLLVRNILLYDWNNVLRKYVGLLVVKCSPYLYWGYYVWAVKQILLQHLTYNQDNSTERINTKHTLYVMICWLIDVDTSLTSVNIFLDERCSSLVLYCVINLTSSNWKLNCWSNKRE